MQPMLFDEHGFACLPKKTWTASGQVTCNARHDDHITSKQAGREFEASGKAEAQRIKIVGFLRENHDGWTAKEIEHKLDGLKAHKRMKELKEAKLVRNGEDRVCSQSKRNAMTWYLK